jgi:hypothetical protein
MDVSPQPIKSEHHRATTLDEIDDGSLQLAVTSMSERVTTTKRTFVLVGNPHLYWVSNRYKPYGTNVVENFYRVEPRPGTNVPFPLRRDRGAFVRGEGTTGTNDGFFMVHFSNIRIYLFV